MKTYSKRTCILTATRGLLQHPEDQREVQRQVMVASRTLLVHVVPLQSHNSESQQRTDAGIEQRTPDSYDVYPDNAILCDELGGVVGTKRLTDRLPVAWAPSG